LSCSIGVENYAGLNRAVHRALIPAFAKEASRGHGQNNIAQSPRNISRSGGIVIANQHMYNHFRR